MVAKRKRQPYQSTGYIDGNTARKQGFIGQQAAHNYYTVPDIERQRRQAPAPRRHIRRKPSTLTGISKTSLFLLTLAIGATLYFCIEFLMLQHEVSKMEKDIVSMEQNLAAIRNENDAAYEQINTVYDLDYVYNIAVNELGMVYPNNNEVILFEKADESFVRQYADIPK